MTSYLIQQIMISSVMVRQFDLDRHVRARSPFAAA